MEVVAITKSEKKTPKSFKILNNCACEDCRKAVFSEICHTDERRQTDALSALHGRLTEQDRERAYKWTAYYRALVDGSDTE